jgi:hypothetical protein
MLYLRAEEVFVGGRNARSFFTQLLDLSALSLSLLLRSVSMSAAGRKHVSS